MSLLHDISTFFTSSRVYHGLQLPNDYSSLDCSRSLTRMLSSRIGNKARWKSVIRQIVTFSHPASEQIAASSTSSTCTLETIDSILVVYEKVIVQLLRLWAMNIAVFVSAVSTSRKSRGYHLCAGRNKSILHKCG
jgi:hypothetical protein